MKKTRKWTPILLSLATGIMYGTSYPPFPGWALFFSLVPLWFLWTKSESWKQIFITGFIAQFVFNLIGFNWVSTVASEFGHIPPALSFLVLIGFCAFGSIHVVVAGVLADFTRRKYCLTPGWFLATLAVITGTLEFFWPMIFPWNFSYPLFFSHFKSAQLAEFVGFSVLSLLVIFANAGFTWAAVRYPASGWSRPLIVFLLSLFATEFLGNLALTRIPTEDRQLNVLLVQPNIGNFDKFIAERGQGFQEPIVRKLFDLTLQGLRNSSAKLDLIVWPETAYPENLDSMFRYEFYTDQLYRFVASNHVPLVTGSYSRDVTGVAHPIDYNAVFAIDETGKTEPVYRKHLLLAFGEHFPGGDYFPWLYKIVPEISNFGQGKGPTVFHIAQTLISPLVCYEALYSSYVRQTVAMGGRILVNVINDSWFGKNFEPYQHMYMGIARAIEFRRPFVRVTNTGISAIADVRGKILLAGPQDQEWTETAEVPYYSRPRATLFYYLSPFIPYFYIMLLAVTVMIARYKCYERT